MKIKSELNELPLNRALGYCLFKGGVNVDGKLDMFGNGKNWNLCSKSWSFLLEGGGGGGALCLCVINIIKMCVKIKNSFTDVLKCLYWQQYLLNSEPT